MTSVPRGPVTLLIFLNWAGVPKLTPLWFTGQINDWVACELVGAPSTGLDIHMPHNLKEVGKEKTLTH